MVARLADELRMEQEHAQSQERARKGLEVTMKDLQGRLEEAEQSILKGGTSATNYSRTQIYFNLSPLPSLHRA